MDLSEILNYQWFNFGRDPAGILNSESLWNFRYLCVKGGTREPLAKRRWWRDLANSFVLAEVPAGYDCFLVYGFGHWERTNGLVCFRAVWLPRKHHMRRSLRTALRCLKSHSACVSCIQSITCQQHRWLVSLCRPLKAVIAAAHVLVNKLCFAFLVRPKAIACGADLSFRQDVLFFFRARDLRDAWADRREILHDGQY